MSNPIPISLTSTLPFKKHAGKIVSDVLRVDPGYLFWLLAGEKVVMKADLEALVVAWGDKPANRRESQNILSKFKKISIHDKVGMIVSQTTVTADYNEPISAEPETASDSNWGCW